uniref:Sushi domain containing 5 n=1 Tax=Xiphophorus maculatus TaxID=8083 RepID=A0A3B5Q4A0_XIPMA
IVSRRDPRSLQGFGEPEQACASQNARLASAEELRQAVVECFFSHCTRGWLYGGTVGTTVCSVEGSSLKAVNVKTENATEDTAHLSAFCMKDKTVTCGDPPSFPNARLQDHSGFEMGDELLYTCTPGYVMPSGHSAFSLLCDSCGEWYGTVQICIKGGTETHVDYEDKLEDSYEETDPMREEDAFTVHPRFEQDSTKLVRTGAAPATKEPLSLLSQKHMFWFPSETFQEEVLPISSNSVTQATQRASGARSEESKEHESQERLESTHSDHDDDHRDNDGEHPDNSEEHPTSDDHDDGEEHYDHDEDDIHDDRDDKDEESYDDHDSHEDDDHHPHLIISVTTDKPNNVEVRKRVPHISLSDEDVSFTVAPKSDQGREKKNWPGSRTPATSSDHSELSNSDTLDYATQQVAPTHSWLDDLTNHPFLDHGPAPPVHDGNTFPGVIEEHTVDNLPGMMGEMEGEKRKTICVGEDCPPHPPSSTIQGAKVAAIIVAVCAVATAVIIGVWCYRRKQQKSSLYEMNGKGQSQSRQGQQIEMQQKV